MEYSQGMWGKSKRGWIIRTETERICRVFHDRSSDGTFDEVALGNLRLLLAAPAMYETLRCLSSLIDCMSLTSASGFMENKHSAKNMISEVINAIERRSE